MNEKTRAKGPRRGGGLVHYPVLMLFGVFFAGMFLLDLATPDRAVSELENTTLTQRPAVTAQILTPRGLNNFFNSYSQYAKDQVPGRDGWISLQSFIETALLQKTQSGGVLLGAEGQMFDRSYGLVASEERTLPRNIAAAASLAARWPGKVYVMVAPAASAIYPERVPAAAPLLNEEVYLAQIKEAARLYKQHLVGKTCIAITNLPPRAMMGIESCGMLISALHTEAGEERLHLLMVDDHIPAGAKLY